MEIVITGIKLHSHLGQPTHIVLDAELPFFNDVHATAPTLKVSSQHQLGNSHLNQIPMPASLSIKSAIVHIQEGMTDKVQLKGTISGFDESIDVIFEAPERDGEDYLIRHLGVVPKTLAMSKGKKPKLTGLCPICFQRQPLSSAGKLVRHKEGLDDWKLWAWCEKSILQQQDRRADLHFFDENHPGPEHCSGSYFPPIEVSMAGLRWSLSRHQVALASNLEYLSELLAGGPKELLLRELGKHETLLGNAMHTYILSKDDPKYPRCLEEEIAKARRGISDLGQAIQKLRRLIGNVAKTHAYGSNFAPLWRVSFDFVKVIGCPELTHREVQEIVDRHDAFQAALAAGSQSSDSAQCC